MNQNFDPKDKTSALVSDILSNLVTYSEMWETPTPSVSNIKARFEGSTLNAWPTYTQVPLYCAYSKEKSPVCDKLKLGDYTGNGIIYKRDEYWNKAATIPRQANVLLLSSQLDPEAPFQYAKSLFDALDGENKELITFGYTAGSSFVALGTSAPADSCGVLILTSYVQNNGNLAKLDKSCMQEEALNWSTPIEYQYSFLSTDEAYDGEFDPSLSAILSE